MTDLLRRKALIRSQLEKIMLDSLIFDTTTTGKHPPRAAVRRDLYERMSVTVALQTMYRNLGASSQSRRGSLSSGRGK